MSDTDGPYLVASLLCLVLVGSAFLTRRVPIGQTARMALAWIGIFLAVFSVFTFRNEFSMVGQRLKSELLGTPIEQGTEVRIPMADDGHFWTVASINGREARFMVDSGATTTTISSAIAEEAGLERGAQAIVETANGTVGMAMARGRFRLGSIDRPDMRVLVNDRDSSNVIGMNFLSSLSSWRVEGSQLVLQP